MLAVLLLFIISSSPRPDAQGNSVPPTPILEYRFNETGSTSPSTGLDPTFVALKNADGVATDLHGASSSGVSGQPSDRAFDNTNPAPPSGGGDVGLGVYGGRAEQPTDDNNVDGLVSLTLQGWFKSSDPPSVTGNAGRLFDKNDGYVELGGFDLAWKAGVIGFGVKGQAGLGGAESPTAYFSGNQWIFFAVTYDGTTTTDNIKFYQGTSSSSVGLVATYSAASGAVKDSTLVKLALGNGSNAVRSFPALLDNMRVFGSHTNNSGVLTQAQLETVRLSDLQNVPLEIVTNSTADAPDLSPGDGNCQTAANECTLRAAVQEANALAGPNTIVLSAGTYTFAIPGLGEEAAATGDLDITSDITIVGAGSAATIIDANHLDRVFDMSAGSLSLSGVTIRNGQPGTSGGGINAGGPLTLVDVIVEANDASPVGNGGGIRIYNFPLNATNVTLRNNHTAGAGGGISADIGVTLTNVTLNGNSANIQGGGFAGGGGTWTNVTVSNNSSTTDGGIRFNGALTLNSVTVVNNPGGGIANVGSGAVSVNNTIVANNSGFNCSGAIGSSLHHNLETGTDCGFTHATDLQAVADPKLGALASNGGLTQTHALLAGSPAIDAGLAAPNCPTVDQRGITRPQGAACDIGAFERIAQPDLTIAKTHSGDFTQGQTGATYTITTSNGGSGTTTGLVTVTDTLPAGLTATAIGGTGWSCDLSTLTCTRSDALNPLASYPTITLTVNVAANAPASVTNTTSVSGGGELNTGNDTATDPTTVLPVPPSSTTVQSNLNPSNYGQLVTFTATVSSAAGTPTGSVTFKDGVNPLGTVPLTSGTAALSTNVLSPGAHSITASYSGATNQDSISSVLSQVVVGPSGGLCVNPGGTGGCYSDVQSAINAANAGDTIAIAVGTYSTSCVANGATNVESELIAINKDLALVGAGAGNTILSGGCRVVHVYAGTVTISGVTVTGATEPLGFGGGGVRNDSNLTMTDSVITGNSSFGGGGGFLGGGTSNLQNVIFDGNSAGGNGGAMRTVGVTTLTDVTIRNNHVNAGSCGAGICDTGAQLTLNRVTLSGNDTGEGAAIDLGAGGLVTLTNVTITGNNSSIGGALVAKGGRNVVLNNVTIDGNSGTAGAGIVNGGATITLRNSIVSNNSGGDCQGSIVSGDYNLIKNTTGCTITGNVAHNLTGQDPNLVPLASNGGLTQTMALCVGSSSPSPLCLGPSPALNGGNPAAPGSGGNACAATDQRGVNRQTLACDIGAYQVASLRASQSITVTTAAPASAAFTSTFPVVAMASSGLAVAITTTGGCSGTGSGSATITMTSSTTTCVVHYNQAGDANYSAASEVTSNTTAAPASQSISVTTAAPSSAAFNSTFAVAATASSGLAVAITTTGGCSGSGSGSATVTMTSGTTTCVVHYNQTGDANYSTAPEVTSNTTATPASQSITVTTAAPPSAALNGTFPVAATASSALAVAITTTGGCSGSGSGSATVTMISSTTTCVVHFNQAGDANYSAATEVTSSTTATPTSQSITVTTAAPSSAALNGTFPVAATASSALAVAITTAGGCSGSGSGSATVTMISSTTTCVVHFNQAGDANYSAATEVLASVTPTKASQTISFGPLADRRLNQSPVTVSATSSATLSVTFTTTTPSRCTAGGTNGSTITLLTTGTCTVKADQGGNLNYSAAPSVTQSFTIGNKTDQTITVGTAAPATAPYGATFPVAATASSGLSVTITTTGGCSIAGGTVTMTSGTTACVVHFNQSGNGSYNPALEILESVSAQKINQTIAVTTALPASAAFNSSFPVAATATSGLGVSITTSGGCSGSGTGSATVTMNSSTTTCDVHYNQAGNANYAAATGVLRSVTATKANQTISFGGLANRKLNQSPVTVSATVSSGLPVAFTTTTPAVCTSGGTNGATITLIATGICTVKADQGGNVNYFAAAAVMQSFTVRP